MTKRRKRPNALETPACESCGSSLAVVEIYEDTGVWGCVACGVQFIHDEDAPQAPRFPDEPAGPPVLGSLVLDAPKEERP